VIDRLQGFFGFTRTPFGRDLAPGMLHRHASHGEAVVRIGWCVAERQIGVITGEVGAGKTVAALELQQRGLAAHRCGGIVLDPTPEVHYSLLLDDDALYRHPHAVSH
jgi:type II secretory pathway predicted ATPase ExeA